jgi:hypothetical protein
MIRPAQITWQDMMILGQSIFDAVLDRLSEEDDADLPPDGFGVEAPSAAIRGLNAGFVAASIGIPLAGGEGRLDDAYFDFADARPVSPSRPELDEDARMFSRLSPQEVAEELGLTAANSAESLHAARRAFARRNHPDLVAELFRDRATLRMKIANLLIDEALKRLP